VVDDDAVEDDWPVDWLSSEDWAASDEEISASDDDPTASVGPKFGVVPSLV